ncbi:glycosyltransferase family 39 protein [Tsukamurella sp. 8F]|uniref:glycosyltransferase family 39 protein n=1 Tax=unclassified Tsukamurella TaxID=2633480 RepID=UPI0023B9713C|nr:MULTISPECIES: glycosyltransferase family 39 protein [unclassified Tsukamurella]MDF0529143.1 glycosyltransferase family 39 protein [Tsukamurella sp. 8J]MDF0585328.1 glycosyltransferase family 39 protein [Tsukamurella sp. 8F]
MTAPTAPGAGTALIRTNTDAPTERTGRRWDRYGLTLLLIVTAVAYLWGLDRAGWSNAFYSAAVQAGTESWKAFLFGSSDAANSITVDKPPAFLWVMEISTRIFGFNTWAILVPEALMGVATVAVVHLTVRPRFGTVAGLLAGAIVATTPVAALMFRFDNPDALLMLLLAVATWATLKAVDDGRVRWLVLTGACIGFGFLTKQLAAMLVVPPLALTYLIAGPPRLGKRILHLLAAGGAMVAAAGWWIALAEFWPASDRPYFGGSQNNSILELTLGYNGLGRLSGKESGSVVPGGGSGTGGGMWGETGLTRMWQHGQASQIAWLLGVALIALVVVLVLCGRAPRTDARRATAIAWGGWLLVTGLTFSLMAGIFHSYYTVALAPAIGALVGAGAASAWRARDRRWVRGAAAIAVAVAGWQAWSILSDVPDWNPWLRWVIATCAVVATATLLASLVPTFAPGARPPGLRRAAATGTLLAALVAGLAGPLAYTVVTLQNPAQGSIPSAGPSSGFGPGGLGRGGFGPGGAGAHGRHGGHGSFTPGMGRGSRTVGDAEMPVGIAPGRGMRGGMGGMFGGGTVSESLKETLLENADAYTWVAATVGANQAATYQLATLKSVMPIGGYNGTDPSPTLQQFQGYVKQGRIHYFVVAGGPFGGSSEGTATSITSWVEQNYAEVTIDGTTMYDLTQPN